MRRWLAIIITIVGVIVGLVAARRGCGATTSREQSPSRTRSPTLSVHMPHRNSEPAGSLRLTGRVVDADGQGVAGASVWINSVPLHMVTSARDGTFEFDSLVSRSYEVRAQAGDLVGGPQVIRLSENAEPIVIRLREGAHVLVTVVDATRAPIANASVRVVGTDSTTTTDASGKARITAHPGWIGIEASGPGYAPRRVNVTTASPSTTSRITIILHEGFEVSGRVLDQTRKPIPNVRVYARQSSGFLTFDDDEPETTVTDNAGAFTIPSAVGMHTLIAIDDEHAPTTTPAFDIDRPIDDLEIVMKPGRVYAGTVVDADGKPAAQARVYLDTLSSALGPHLFSASSDAHGAFEMRGLPRSVPMALARAVLDERASDEVTVEFAEKPELRGQTLTLKHGDTTGVIAGVVVDDTGNPMANVVVNVAASRALPAAIMSTRGGDSSTATSTNTNARGEFTIRDLLLGEYGIWPGALDQPPFPAYAANYRTGIDASSFMTTVKTGDKAVRLVMARPSRITGKVAFADTGDVVNEFKLDIQPRGDREGEVSGEHGAFDVRDVKPGTYALRISGPGFLETNKADVRVDAGKIIDLGTITVERGRTLRGKVVDSDGRGVAGARVIVGHMGVYGGMGRFDEPYFELAGAVTDASGAFTIVGGIQIKSSPTMQLVVGADHSSYGRALPVAVPSGTQDPPPITLTLLECGSIAGKVTQDGQPVFGATIGAGWPEIGVATTNDDGEFVMSRLPVGAVPLRIRVPKEMLRSHQSTVQVEAGKRTEVTIDIPAGTIKLSVVVTPRPGAEVAGALLFLFSGTVAFEDYAQLSTRLFADMQGVARWDGDANHPAAFERVVPGDYTVCTIPLAWSPNDQKQMKRVNTDRAAVKVYCAPARVAAAPESQTLTVDVPSMAPLP